MAMAVTVTSNVASPGLEQLQWRVGEVEKMVAELWARWIGQRCGGGGARARRRRAAMMTAALYFATVSMRERKRARVSVHMRERAST